MAIEAHSAKLTIEATRTPQGMTLRVSLMDETNVPVMTGAATLATSACGEKEVDDVLRVAALQSILDKCEDLGWRRLCEKSRASLRDWNEHSALGHILRRLLVGIEQAERKRHEDGARDRERAVGVVDPSARVGDAPGGAVGGAGDLLQPGGPGPGG